MRVTITNFITERSPGPDILVGGYVETKDSKRYNFGWEHGPHGWYFDEDTAIPESLEPKVEEILKQKVARMLVVALE